MCGCDVCQQAKAQVMAGALSQPAYKMSESGTTDSIADKGHKAIDESHRAIEQLREENKALRAALNATVNDLEKAFAEAHKHAQDALTAKRFAVMLAADSNP